jgi:hypothetical protein
MKLDGDKLRFAARDVTTFGACPHATLQALGLVEGRRAKPPYYADPSAELLAVRGHMHEATYLTKLREMHAVEEIPQNIADAPKRTLEAMRLGVEVVYQGTLRLGDRWYGRSDFPRAGETRPRRSAAGPMSAGTRSIATPSERPGSPSLSAGSAFWKDCRGSWPTCASA